MGVSSQLSQVFHGVLPPAQLRLAPEAEYLATVISAWEGHYVKTLARVGEVVSDLKSARDTDIAMLSVLLRELRMLA